MNEEEKVNESEVVQESTTEQETNESTQDETVEKEYVFNPNAFFEGNNETEDKEEGQSLLLKKVMTVTLVGIKE